MFKSAADNSEAELLDRSKLPGRLLKFGINFLDDAMLGIFPDDLVLLGAPSGVGKTQLCCDIAIKNVEAGKTVHYFALEASEFEIEKRLKYPIVMDLVPKPVRYTEWASGNKLFDFADEEVEAQKIFRDRYKNLFLYYRGSSFNVETLVHEVNIIEKQTDLIIIDHAHYFDYVDDNENRALKKIAITARHLAKDLKKPIILVAHLRKRDKQSDELIAGIEEFHGSSDLFRVATQVITLAPGPNTPMGYETYVRIGKNRTEGGVNRYSCRMYYNPHSGKYSDHYDVGIGYQKRGEPYDPLPRDEYPEWAR